MTVLSRMQKVGSPLVVLALCLALSACKKDGKDGKEGKENGGPSSKVTKENFAKVKDGMTEKQLTAILGPPTDSKDKDDGAKELNWKNGNNTITITLDKKGKLDSKTSVFVN